MGGKSQPSSYIMRIFSHGNRLIADLLRHEFFLIQDHGEDHVIVGVSGFAQSVMEFKLLGVARHTFFGVP